MIRDEETGEWIDTYAHKKRVVVTLKQVGELADFWGDMMVIAHDSGTPQEIVDVLKQTMHDFPLWVVKP
jgi:hypothetical protein